MQISDLGTQISAHLLADLAVRLRDIAAESKVNDTRVRATATMSMETGTESNGGVTSISDAEVDALILEAKDALQMSLVIAPGE